jgi:hypothetical protein
MPVATSELAEVIRALASLVWPLGLLFFIWLFHSEITHVNADQLSGA